jgi:hypothetical protein
LPFFLYHSKPTMHFTAASLAFALAFVLSLTSVDACSRINNIMSTYQRRDLTLTSGDATLRKRGHKELKCPAGQLRRRYKDLNGEIKKSERCKGIDGVLLPEDDCKCIPKCARGFIHPFNEFGSQISSCICSRQTQKKKAKMCEILFQDSFGGRVG